MCAYARMSEKWDLLHRNPEKSGHSCTFCCKKGASHIPGSAEKGGHLHAHPYYAIYRKLPPRPEVCTEEVCLKYTVNWTVLNILLV